MIYGLGNGMESIRTVLKFGISSLSFPTSKASNADINKMALKV